MFVQIEWLLAASALCRISLAFRVNIVSVTLGDNPVFGYAVQGPAMDVAFQHALASYPRLKDDVTRTVIYNPGDFSCGDAASFMPIVASQADSIISQEKTFTIVIVTGCSLEVLAIGDFAREWNTPLITTIGSDPQLANMKRYPTVVSFSSGDNVSRMKAIVKLLERFQWTTISLLCDTLSDMPQNAALTATTCRSIMAIFDSDKERYSYSLQRFDSKADHSADASYRRILQAAANQSRVIFILSDPSRTRNVMVVAHELNMTAGDYIYIVPISTKVPGQGEMTWQAFDENDQAAKEAFQSLIYVNNINPNWERITGLLDELANRSSAAYNYNLTSDTYRNDMAIIAYEAMESIAMVLNETIGTGIIHRRDADKFRQHFLNRTFYLNSRSVAIRANGFRASDVLCSRLNLISGMVEPAWRYFSLEDQLREVSQLGGIWRDGRGPPSNRPKCGFQNDRCYGEDGSLRSPLIAGLCSLLAIILVLVGAFIWWKRRQDLYFSGTWWILDWQDVAFRISNRSAYRYMGMFSRNFSNMRTVLDRI